mmetsp:Transcript_6354/g.20259  ORF Transcript_6354/g.20259 Transcript_6354/m.20259 type:complete len:223 (-) Transcript_6354:42-710(-)
MESDRITSRQRFRRLHLHPLGQRRRCAATSIRDGPHAEHLRRQVPAGERRPRARHRRHGQPGPAAPAARGGRGQDQGFPVPHRQGEGRGGGAGQRPQLLERLRGRHHTPVRPPHRRRAGAGQSRRALLRGALGAQEPEHQRGAALAPCRGLRRPCRARVGQADGGVGVQPGCVQVLVPGGGRGGGAARPAALEHLRPRDIRQVQLARRRAAGQLPRRGRLPI